MATVAMSVFNKQRVRHVTFLVTPSNSIVKMNELVSELLSVQAISEQDILLMKCPKTLCDPITVMNLRHEKIKYKHQNEKMANDQNQRKRQAENGSKDNGPRKHDLKVINKAIEDFKREIEFIKKRFEMQMKPMELLPEDNTSGSLKFQNSKNCVIQNTSFRKWKNSVGATRAQENMPMRGEQSNKLKSNSQLKSDKMVSREKSSVAEDPLTEDLDHIKTGVMVNEYSKERYIKGETEVDEKQLHNVLKNSSTVTGLLGNPEHVTKQILHPISNKVIIVHHAPIESKNRILGKQKHAQMQSNKCTLKIKKSKLKADNGNISEDDMTKFNQPSNEQIISKYYFMWKNYAFQCKFHQSNGYQNSLSKESCEHKMKIERLVELLENKKIEQKLVVDEDKNFSTTYCMSNKIRKISDTSKSIPNETKADFISADDSCSTILKKTNKILLKYKLACEERDKLMDSLAKARKIRKLETDNEADRRQPAGEVPKWVFNPVHIIETNAKERSKCRKMQIEQRRLRREAEIQALLKEEQLRLEEERLHLQFMSEKANKFHESMLYKKCLLRPLNILANMRKKNYVKCENFRKKKLLHFYFNTWSHSTLSPFRVAQDFVKQCMLKRGYTAFSKVRIVGIQNNQVAMDFYDYFLIPHQAFTCWMKYHHIHIYKMERTMKISISHYNRALIRKYFSLWKIFHQDREIEVRRNIWRMRVQEILPDFTPNIFCSRL